MIGWYVHHHGVGHRRRLEAVVPHLSTHVTGLGSGPPPASELGISWVPLSRDDAGGTATDPTAGGTMHWAPLRDDGLRHRMATIAGWAHVADCRVFVVDGSIEVAMLGRLLGLPTVVMAHRGRREDRPHHLVFDAATAIIAPWSRETQPRWPGRWLEKTHWIGGLSRYDGRAPTTEGVDCTHDRCVTFVVGTGGHVFGAGDLEAAADATPGWHWHVLGRVPDPDHPRVEHHGWVEDPWPWLCHATVVAGPNGGGLVGEAAAAGARLVALPQPRPYREHEDMALRLGEAGVLVPGPVRPKAADWPVLLDAAMALDPTAWGLLHDGKGAVRAANLLDAMAEDRVAG